MRPSHIGKQLSQSYIRSASKSLRAMNSRASSVEFAGRRKALLRIALLLAQLADSQSKSHQNVGSLSHANHWNVDNEYHTTDYEYHSGVRWNDLRCPNGFSGVMAARVITEPESSTTNTPSKSEHIFNQISGDEDSPIRIAKWRNP